MKGFIETITIAIVVFITSAITSYAQDIEVRQNVPTGLPRNESVTNNAVVVEQVNTPTRPFAFGVEAGATMDFSGTESSHFDIDIYGGYRKGLIQTLGLGIGFHPSFANNRTFIPIYALFRCNFKEGRSLCFADVKAGMSINELSSSKHFTGAYGSVGIGFNLLQNHRLKTHAIIGYNITQITPFEPYTQSILHGVSIRIGITF